MSLAAHHARTRDALLGAILPAPGRGLPALADLDLSPFWPRFFAVAPLHLRLGLGVAVVVLGSALPRALGHLRALPGLAPEVREAIVVRAHGLPLLRDLCEVAKIVACFAYFSDPAVQAAARRRT